MAKAPLDDTACRPVRYINRNQQSKSISGEAVLSPARFSCISTAIRSNSESISRPHGRVDQGDISTAKAVYEQQSKRKQKHFWPTQPCPPGRCLNREQQCESISGASVYHQRGIAVYQQQSKTQAKALLDDTAGSTRAVYQPRELYINSNQN